MPKAKTVAVLAILLIIFLIFVGSHGKKTTGTTSTSTTTVTGSAQTTLPETTISTLAINGGLHTSGKELVDANGNEITLVGANLNGLQLGSGGNAYSKDRCGEYWINPPSSFYDAIEGLGFNSVRLPVSWANLEPTPPTHSLNGTLVHHWNMAYVTALDNAVQNLSKRNILIIFEMHQDGLSSVFNITQPIKLCEGDGYPGWLFQHPNQTGYVQAGENFVQDKPISGLNNLSPQQALTDVWLFLVNRYRNNSRVLGADMLNEPFQYLQKPDDGKALESLYVKLGTSIHQANPSLLLVFENCYTFGGPSSTGCSLPGAPSIPNAVYSFHGYVSTWKGSFENYVNQEINLGQDTWKIPVYDGEFNTGGHYAPDPAAVNWEQLAPYVSNLTARNVSWSLWAASQLASYKSSPSYSGVTSILQSR